VFSALQSDDPTLPAGLHRPSQDARVIYPAVRAVALIALQEKGQSSLLPAALHNPVDYEFFVPGLAEHDLSHAQVVRLHRGDQQGVPIADGGGHAAAMCLKLQAHAYLQHAFCQAAKIDQATMNHDGAPVSLLEPVVSAQLLPAGYPR